MPPPQLRPSEHNTNTSFTYSIYEGMGDIFLNGQQQPPSICDKILLSDCCWIKVLLKCLLFFFLSLKEKVSGISILLQKKKESVKDKKKFFFMSTTAGGVK